MRQLSIRRVISAIVLVLTLTVSGFAVTVEVQLRPGESYKIVNSVYLMAVYESMDDKRESRGPTRAYLQPERYAKTRWVAFQCAVPVGTVMTIVGPAPPARELWNRYDAYYVNLKLNPSRQLAVIVPVARAFSDTSGGLSRKFFEPMNRTNDDVPGSLAGCIELK